MIGITAIAEVAALMGDPARANMLLALRDDEYLSAGDLTAIAGIAPSTASEHLAKLGRAGLVKVTPLGRKRYYSLADPAVAEVLSGVEGLAGTLSRQKPAPLPWYQATIHARCCLDHLAGRLGAQLAAAALNRNLIVLKARGPALTGQGAVWLTSLRIDVDALQGEPRRFLRLCPDWIEETTHLGGALGAALLRAFVDLQWLHRVPGSSTLQVTPKGVAGFRSHLDLDLRSSAT